MAEIKPLVFRGVLEVNSSVHREKDAGNMCRIRTEARLILLMEEI